MIHLDGFRFSTLLQTRQQYALYQGVRERDGQAVIAKVLSDSSRHPQDSLWLRHEYEQARRFPQLPTAPFLVFHHFHNQVISVKQELQGSNLKSFMNSAQIERCQTHQRIALVLQITRAVAQFHQARLFHFNLQPRHILLLDEPRSIALLDLTASVEQRHHLIIPAGIHHPLSRQSDILAPEQLGMIDRRVNDRADLFMLGCIFFEIFTGQAPFPSGGEAVVRLTHRPLQMQTFNSQLPDTLYPIVLRLLHFDPDKRYQNIADLLADLEHCDAQINHPQAKLATPTPNTQPNLNVYSIKIEETRPQAKERLHGLLDRMIDGEHTWVTIRGPAGHDKSQLIRDLKGHVTSKGGLFIESACNPTHKLTPHGPLRVAIGTWINLLADCYPAILEEMQRKTQKALGPNSSLLEGIIPNWEKLVPNRTSLVSLPAPMARNRFKFVFRKFVTTFLNTPIPVVLVFDDMQWADDSSLELLNLIRHSVQPRNLMVIAAYRGKHQFSSVFQNWDAEHFEIAPLDVEQIQHLVARYYPHQQDDGPLLAELIFQSTQGIPYGTWRLFEKMEQDGLLRSDDQGRNWSWDVAQLRQELPRWQLKDWANFQIGKIPEATQEVLACASLIGRKFNLEQLAVVSNHSLPHLRDHLLVALESGLVLPHTCFFAQLPWMTAEHLADNKRRLTFTFENNLIHASLIEKMDLPERAAGYTALAQFYTGLQECSANATFWEADCYQYAVEMGAVIDWLTRVVALMRAGRLAKNRHALSSASHYYARAVDLCEDQYWHDHFELLYKLHLEAIECAYLCHDESSAAWLHETLIEKAQKPTQRSEISHKRSAFLRDRIRLKDALSSYLSALAELGLNVPLYDDATRNQMIQTVEQQLQNFDVQLIAKLPALNELHLQQAGRILSEILPLAYFIGQETFLSIVYYALELMLKEGLYDGVPRVLGAYATILLNQDPDRAFAIAKIAEHLDRNQITAVPDTGTRGFLLIFVHHWFRPIREVLTELAAEIKIASEVGEMDGYNYGVASYYASCAAHSYPLNELKNEAHNIAPLLEEFNLTFAASMVKIWGQFVNNLVDSPRNPWLLTIPGMMPLFDTQTTPTSQLEHNLRLQYHLAQLMLALVFRDVDLALTHTEFADQHLTTAPRMPNVSKLIFYGALAYLQAAKRHPEKAELYRDVVDQKYSMLTAWAKYAPSNRNHELQLLRAEMAGPNDDMNQIIEHYDLAIESARQNHFTLDQALASELAAEFYLSRHREVISRTYLNDARNLYQIWGATAKIKQLNQRALRFEQSGSNHAEMVEKLNREIENTQKQLMEQESMANLGNLTAGITHEIRNPLNFITNFAAVGVELLEDLRQLLHRHQVDLGDDFQEITTMVDDLANNNAIIQKQGARAENIVRAMLRVSRTAKDTPRATDLNQLLDEDINLAYHGHAKKTGLGVVIHRQFSADIGMVDIVSRNISRVFLNLLNNAFYALAERKENSNGDYQPEIWVRTYLQAETVCVEVRDNGIGIEANILETVFTPFFTTKPTGEGTGIGLAMSKEIIENEHAGKLVVSSVLNQATSFIIQLPRHQAAASIDRSAT